MFELPDELKHYKSELDRKRIPYKVLSESSQPDGSVLLLDALCAHKLKGSA